MDLTEIRQRVDRLATVIGLQHPSWPKYEWTPEGQYIEVDHAYHYVETDRGLERARRTTLDSDELLYWIFAALTRAMAREFAMLNSVPGRDFRRAMFARQLELLGQLSTSWRAKHEKEINDLLVLHPYLDKPA